ncbi:DUF4855 domain-containing protein [Heliorestis convoluta]|uniref:DUF4855 domain-containing protein n=1 Tax=Heliorestis convoluta TaxID=356322 RepID=A0A5Q2MWS0_9FIRM|nr:DUF4855 domain-containing protein [Heliorestis convoluta]QGG47014.1 hypothetical protein FTV88_0857 [Heliorestis convoluta]
MKQLFYHFSFFIFSLILLFPTASESHLVKFHDLKGHKAERAVAVLAEHGIIKGTAEGEFQPERAVTREEFAVILGKTLGLQPLYLEEEVFSDLPSHSFAFGYVMALRATGIIQGRSEDFFGSSHSLTRQEGAVLIDRSLSLVSDFQEVSELLFWEDREKIAPYAKDAVARLTALDWFTMYQEENLFRPEEAISRGEVAILCQKVHDQRLKIAKKPFRVEPLYLQARAGFPQQIQLVDSMSPYPASYGIDQAYTALLRDDGVFQPTAAAAPAYITVNQGLQSVQIPVRATSHEPINESEDELLYPLASLKTITPLASTVEITGFTDAAYIELEKKSYPGPTQGLLSYSPTWTGYYRQQSRAVTVDLGSLKKVSRFSLQFLGNKDQGITLPQEMMIEISQDGSYWNYIGKVLRGPEETEERGPTVKTFSLTSAPVEAQYIRISFPVEVWTFARWLRVEGPAHEIAPPQSEKNLLTLVPQGAPPVSTSYVEGPNRERLRNPIRDLLLIYTGPHQNSEWRREDFLPMIAYRTTDGEFVDSFFDGMLFLPYVNLPSNPDSWRSYLDNLFTPERQLHALNDAVSQWKKMGKSTLQNPYPVVLTLPYPNNQQGSWKSYEERREALFWYKKELEKRWQEADFDHLELVGFYWEGEAIYNKDDATLIREIASILRFENRLFYWIPYYEAAGLKDWLVLGFDQVYLQPNYYFVSNTTTERLENARKIANHLGIGLELEGDERFMNYPDFQQRYLDYLKWPREDHMSYAYYYGSKNLLRAMYSGNSEVHRIYHQPIGG